MAIQKLPALTVRALGSSQTLTDPASLVKELLDNALDAHSTSIAIEISTNTVDVIQVKDNGHGIAPEDRPAMAVRYSTSKIRDLEEMRRLGGRSLGFRGEALAAAAQMAGKMVITTRVEGEAVAEACTIWKDGNLAGREPVSHPAGTTVRVLDFLKNLPVRRENAVKNANAQKTLGTVKRSLQGYAFARPEVRLSFKVLGAKSEKGNWSYVPRKGGEKKANFGLIVGRDVVGQCVWHTNRPSEEPGGGGHPLDEGSYAIEAFVVKPGADTSKINGKGHFVSIDSRPVSCSRGTLKDIMLLYKSYLRSAFPGCNIENPFISLDIACPPGSYDVNVEPAKDDVLFGDAVIVLTMLDDFFETIYGELTAQSPATGTTSKLSGRKMNSFDVLLARRTPGPEKSTDTNILDADDFVVIDSDEEEMLFSHEKSRPTTDHRPVGTLPLSPAATPRPPSLPPNEKSNVGLGFSAVRDDLADLGQAKTPGPWTHSMYIRDDEDQDDIRLSYNAEDEAALTELEGGEKESFSNRVHILNPFTIAKMNTSLQKRPSGGSPIKPNTNNNLPSPSRTPMHVPSRPSSSGHLPSPENSSSPPPSMPSDERSKRRNMISPKSNGKDRASSGRLDAWIQKADAWNQKTPGQKRPREEPPSRRSWAAMNTPIRGETPAIQRKQDLSFPGSDFINPLHQSRNSLSNDRLHQADSPLPPAAKKQKTPSGLHKPFVSPVQEHNHNWFEMKPLPPSGVTPASRAKTVRDVIAASAPLVFDSESDDSIEECSPAKPLRHAKPVHPDVAELLQFEARKALATKQRREEINLEETTGNETRRPASPNSSPHRSRYQAAKEALQKCNADRTALAKEDPRAYLMDLMTPNDPTADSSMPPPRRLGRTKTMKLPLETTPEHLRVHNLELVVNISILSIEQIESSLCPFDTYVAHGNITHGSLSDIERIAEVQDRLNELVRGMYITETGEEAEVNMDLTMLTRRG